MLREYQRLICRPIQSTGIDERRHLSRWHGILLPIDTFTHSQSGPKRLPLSRYCCALEEVIQGDLAVKALLARQPDS